MSGRYLGQGNLLHTVRAGASGIARLLLVAFTLQLLVPLLDLGAVAAGVGEAALQADLNSSLCHDPGPARSDDGGPAAGQQVKHCIFCMSMAGDHAQMGAEIGLALPARSAAVSLAAGPDQVPDLTRPSFARSRAPPSSPRTV